MLGIGRAGSMKTVASEFEKYNLDPLAVQEARWVEGVVVSKQEDR
jgi:hypothetical protein